MFRNSFMSSVGRLTKLTRSFFQNKRGNIAIPFALTIVPTIGLIGAAVDFSRGIEARVQLQVAADAAALWATRSFDQPFATRQSTARDVFHANLEGFPAGRTTTFNLTEIAGGHRVQVRTTLETTMLAILGIDSFDASASAESAIDAGKLEMALVLDNTGSMSGNMDDLREASEDMINLVFKNSVNDHVKLAVVPYVTSVNIGSEINPANLDLNGDSKYHGAFFENKRIARFDHCSDSADDNSQLPEGYTIQIRNNCEWLYQPSKVNHLDLFDGLRNTEWKGCVEARPEPYDVLDTVPTLANPDTLFVPYFWPDEADEFSRSAEDYNNDYMDDTPIIHDDWFGYDWDKFRKSESRRTYSVLKYKNRTERFDETPPLTYGPNKSCPSAVLPLTTDKESALAKVRGMSHWVGGGTNTSQGLMWGWRILSPEAPFTEGASYETKDLRKVIVLMTDGYNQLVGNNSGGPVLSDYSSYGYAKGGHFPVETISGGRDYINERLTEACSNIKAQGILIYTVLFGTLGEETKQLYRNCATEPAMAFSAKSADGLKNAFLYIGQAVSGLRLSH